MIRTDSYKILLLAIIFIFVSYASKCEDYASTTLTGRIIDAVSGEAIPGVHITFANTTIGTTSDIEGRFYISSSGSYSVVRFSSIGYETYKYMITPGVEQEARILLNPKINALNEVTITPRRKNYRNKNNPAVELIRNVIDKKKENRSENLDFYAYEKYEKIQFSLSDITDKFMDRKAFNKFQFVFDYIDTTKLSGSKVLPVFQMETLSDYYYRKSPQRTKELVKAHKMVSIEDILDNQGMTEYLNKMYQDINIYDNYIPFITNSFLSPIANSAPTFYQFFIQDTLMIEGEKCVHLFFRPRNRADMLFQGSLYINIEKNYAVRKLEMAVNENVNLNWVNDVKIFQEFGNAGGSGWHVIIDELSIDFGITKGSMGVFGQRVVTYENYSENLPLADSVFEGQTTVYLEDAEEKTDNYWASSRPIPLNKSEKGAYILTDSLQTIPAFNRALKLMVLLFSGYVNAGKVEIGPVGTFYSYNPVEGHRARFGGRTTPKFSKKINFETYAAYSFGIERYKYYLGATYSLTDRTIYKFPVKSVKLSFQEETQIPGQELQFIMEDNVLLSIKRGVHDKLFGNRILKLEHLNEFENHFSYALSYSYKRQRPLGNLYYNPDAYEPDPAGTTFLHIAELGANLRYAPNEKFYQGMKYRTPIPTNYPVFQLNYSAGAKLLGNDYDYHKLTFMAFKRFNLGMIGSSDVVVESGNIFGAVPFPLLTIHRANQSYSYQLASYNMMNFLEFVSDRYVSLQIVHHFNGFIFNKIPLFKRLKFREVISAKVLYGSISDENNPDQNPDLFKFPVDALGNPTTFTLEGKPYIEVSAGITNILRFFRIDVVKRLTYLDHPNAPNIGIRGNVKFDF